MTSKNLIKSKSAQQASHLLYEFHEDDRSSVILFDLKKGQKTNFSSEKKLNWMNSVKIANDLYGFSLNGSLVWTVVKDNFVKVKNFIKNKTVVLPLSSSEDGVILSTKISDDRSKFFVGEFSKKDIEKAEKLEEKLSKQKTIDLQEKRRLQDEDANDAMARFNTLDMSSLRLTTYKDKFSSVKKCNVLRDDGNWVLTRRDGSMYMKSIRDQNSQPVEIFDPIEGIHIYSPYDGAFRGHEMNCMFLNENTAVIKHDEKQKYILRLIKERKEFLLTHEDLFGSEEVAFQSFFKNFKFYPFHVYLSEEGFRVYHIPSGQLQIIKRNFVNVGKKGQLAIEIVDMGPEEKDLFQAVLHPFDSSKSQVVLKRDIHEIKHVSSNEDLSLFFVGTALGEFFVIDVDTGSIRKHFFGRQFRGIKISDSGDTFLLKHLDGRDSYYMAHRIRELCVEPVSFLPEDIEKQLFKFAEIKDPAEKSFMAFLTGALKDDTVVKKYPKLMQALLWNIFLHYPKSLPGFIFSLSQFKVSSSFLIIFD